MSTINANIELIKRYIRSYPDFPRANVCFRDIFSVLQQPQIFSVLHDVMLEHVKTLQMDCIVALDSRGFLFGPILALDLQKPFIPIRKKGKLPGKVQSIIYDLEYGQDCFEIQEEAIKPGDKVLIIDDLLATGGSLSAACELVKLSQGVVVECFVIMEIESLNGRDKLSDKVHSLMQF